MSVAPHASPVAIDLDLRALEASAARGDMQAWSALYERFDASLVSWLKRRVGTDTAVEVAQETWLRLMHKQRAGKLPYLKMPGLLFAQANYLAHDEGRRLRANTQVHISAVDAPNDAEARAVASVRLGRVAAVLDQCSPRARDVFLSYQAEGAATVAERYGISVQRVRQCACEVRATLRQTV